MATNHRAGSNCNHDRRDCQCRWAAHFVATSAIADTYTKTKYPIVLVHGGFESADVWEPLASLLGRGHRVDPGGCRREFGRRTADRATGLRWVWPWMSKSKLSARANNIISEKIKVNDLRGNPIEMAAQVVWRVTDTAQALFDVDDYKAFVKVQIEAAVRTIGSRYPYDDFEHQEVTLRGNNDQVKAELRTELINRLAVAGITVDECGFTHLAYASEIAGAMLRRQQAQAVVAARKTLVEGAVGMVEMALDMLSGKKIAELNVDRRAALVSNLMVVLCSERDTQPVVNTGMSQ